MEAQNAIIPKCSGSKILARTTPPKNFIKKRINLKKNDQLKP